MFWNDTIVAKVARLFIYGTVSLAELVKKNHVLHRVVIGMKELGPLL